MVLEPIKALAKGPSQFGECVVMVSASYGGKDNCMPATWSVPVSFNPFMVTVHIGPERFTHGLVEKSGAFGASLLADDQVDICRFAGGCSGREIDKFRQIEHFRAKRLDLPLLKNCVAAMACKVTNSVTAGDHTIFVGEVKEAYWDPSKSPLISFRGEYRSLGKNLGPY